MTTTPASNGERLLPNFQPYKVSVNIDRDQIDVTVTGSVFDGLAELIAKLLKGPISDAIEAEVEIQLNENIPIILNQGILFRDGYRSPLRGDFTFKEMKHDFSVPYPWKVKSTGIEVGISAYTFCRSDPEPTLE